MTGPGTNPVATTYFVSGTVVGLKGTGLVLQNNGGDDLAVAADGPIRFATPLADGAAYAVTVKTAPSADPPQNCVVSNDAGTVGGAAVSNVAVVCTDVVQASLCPDVLDPSVTYTGGAASGEYVKVKFDSAAKRYEMTFVESPVPTSSGQRNDTRAGLTIAGDYVHPDGTALALPSARQNRCAIVLKNGKTASGSYTVAINPKAPPVLFVGHGLVVGGIPGATVQDNGLEFSGGLFLGAVPPRTFDSYPFIGFSHTVTDFTQVAGTYNELGFRVTPEGTPSQSASGVHWFGWETQAIQASQTFNADGSCTPDASQYSCFSTGAPWKLRRNADGTPDGVFTSGANPDLRYPAVGVEVFQFLVSPSLAHGIMIVGKVGDQLVPVIVRVGYIKDGQGNVLAHMLDDQAGFSLLAPATNITQAALTGRYVGTNSASVCGVVTSPGQSSRSSQVNGQMIFPSAGACTDGSASSDAGVNNGAMSFQGGSATLLNPFTLAASSGLALDFTQARPGLVTVTANTDFMSGRTPVFKAGDTGVMVKVGPVYGLLMNGVNRQFTTYDPVNNVSKVNPFLSIGVFAE
ncbi:DUF2957 domain-containing protein [Variovorax sp. KBS0712]|uniref:DUF2957 domain-containing protein n=1 Tax=Variovorax sp. KBS0712 TaxID=2578111 RepID=UPI001C8F5722|nr:DUF2957 domain-containing protein [Variovorax sp. KBS0712]